jgi:hypothetical protein
MTISQREANEQEISLCFQAAIEKLKKVDAYAKKEKTQIVQDLAKNLEGKIPTDRIANEIVHQLHGKASPRLIRRCLDVKYKEKRRVENALKQKRHENTEDLAASVPLNDGNIDRQEKKIVIDTLGNVVVEPQAPIIKGIDGNGEEVIAQSNRRDIMECGNCKIKDSRIKELEDVVRNTTQLTPANQIAEEKDNKTKELDKRTQDLAESSVNHSHDEANQNGLYDNSVEGTADAETKNESMLTHSEITSVSRQKKDLTDTKKEVLVSHISMPFENLRKDMATVFQTTKGSGNVFFKVCIDLGTRVVEIDFCGITQHEPMISTGKGILKEAGTIFQLGT